MIAISFALPAESSGLVALLQNKQLVIRGQTTKSIQGRIDNKSVEIFHTGVGRRSCEGKIGNFLGTAQPRYLISAGFAGAARPSVEVGDLILAENFSDRQVLFEAQRILSNRGACTAKLFTSTTVIDSRSERMEKAHAHDAAAVDMETEVIAQACTARSIPMLSMRVISDSLREPFPAPPSVLFDIERQRTDFAKLSLHLLTHAGAILGLVRFARQIARARNELTSALVALLRGLEL
jgi:adenosylhomocysteine nucleosidase